MFVAYLQPTYAKRIIDGTSNAEGLSWFKQKKRYAAAAFVGLAETISYCTLHVMFSLATFPLTMGYVDAFPRKASHFGARAWGGATATTVAAAAIFSLSNPRKIEEKSIQAAEIMRETILTRFETSLQPQADFIQKRKLRFREEKRNYLKVFQATVEEFSKARSDYVKEATEQAPDQVTGWYDTIRELKYQVYARNLRQNQALWNTSIDPYELACQKAEKFEKKIYTLTKKPEQTENEAQICHEAVRGLRGLLKHTLKQVFDQPDSLDSFLAWLKDYQAEFKKDLKDALENNIHCDPFPYYSPWARLKQIEANAS